MKNHQFISNNSGRVLLAWVAFIVGCGDAGSGAPGVDVGGSSADGTSSDGDSSATAETAPPSAASQSPMVSSQADQNSEGWGDLLAEPPMVPDPAEEERNACGSVRAAVEVISTPIDIVVVLDNSGSMGDETDSVERNINENFSQILEQNGVDYRMIVLSEHRERNGQNAICIASPLSSLELCPAPRPASSERFFHYSVEIGSSNSLTVLLDTYDGTLTDEFDVEPNGWSQWLRPGAKRAFVEITDDDSRLSAADFILELTDLAPEHFGSASAPGFVWHSIVGLAEKPDATEPYFPSDAIEEDECSGNDNNVFNAGRTYQELSRLTGGLRFPICQFQAYDAVFQTIASDLLNVSLAPCQYALPQVSPGLILELDKIAVEYTPGDGGEAELLTQTSDGTDCRADAFFVEGGSIHLCPQACELLRTDTRSQLDVLFSCDSMLTLR